MHIFQFNELAVYFTLNLSFTKGSGNVSSFEELKQTTSNVVDVVQSGALAEKIGPVLSLDVSDPIPPPVDPTGGVRATNETGDFMYLLVYQLW